MEWGEIRKAVRDGYSKITKDSGSCCLSQTPGCGGVSPVEKISRWIGYSREEMQAVPEGANLGMGCGNPVSLANLKEGETVLDLGSGAGFDAFLAARIVGNSGCVLGVDMTPAMLDMARENARKGDYGNVEFRLGEIENLPVADSSVDIIISNCVINLSPDKRQVFREAFRVLNPGGRLIVSDIVLLNRLPVALIEYLGAYVSCIAGTVLKEDYIQMICGAGFVDIKIIGETTFPVDKYLGHLTALEGLGRTDHWEKGVGKLSAAIASIQLSAIKSAAMKR